MKIPPDTLNSNIVYCIDEYVREEDHREILKLHYFKGYTILELSKKYNKSDSAIKKILYDIGDPIIIRASEMTTKNN